jgi:hypothetical protein
MHCLFFYIFISFYVNKYIIYNNLNYLQYVLLHKENSLSMYGSFYLKKVIQVMDILSGTRGKE